MIVALRVLLFTHFKQPLWKQATGHNELGLHITRERFLELKVEEG
jgi:hypothetical protein